MTESLLQKIRKEVEEELLVLSKFNSTAKSKAKLEEEENIKKSLGISNQTIIAPAEKTEIDVIMEVYRKYERLIEEKDTNGIYVYVTSYMPTEYSAEEILEGRPEEIEVAKDNPKATCRVYYNLEGCWSKTIDIKDCDEFEKSNIVIPQGNFNLLQREFIVTAVNKGQADAIKKIINR